MNSLFRNIPENKNLDYIQESDDEFEDNTQNIVNLEKSYKVECQYNKRFNTWNLVNII